jgi:hypothetical protein
MAEDGGEEDLVVLLEAEAHDLKDLNALYHAL